MQTIRATIENGAILLQDPLPHLSGRYPALIVIDDGTAAIVQFSAIQGDNEELHAEEDFAKIGLRDFFGATADERVNWETFFGKEL